MVPRLISLRPLQFLPSHWEILTNRQSDGPAPMVSPQSVYTMMLVMANYTFLNAREMVEIASTQGVYTIDRLAFVRSGASSIIDDGCRPTS